MTIIIELRKDADVTGPDRIRETYENVRFTSDLNYHPAPGYVITRLILIPTPR
jgi:hypothetical protein